MLKIINYIGEIILSALLLIASFLLLGSCGIDPEIEKAPSPVEAEEAEKEQPPPETTFEKAHPPVEAAQDAETPPETASKVLRVEVAVEIETTSKATLGLPTTLLEKGLTMELVSVILGEPDDSANRAGYGKIWKYEKGSENCKKPNLICAVYFDAEGYLEFTYNINPELKNHRKISFGNPFENNQYLQQFLPSRWVSTGGRGFDSGKADLSKRRSAKAITSNLYATKNGSTIQKQKDRMVNEGYPRPKIRAPSLLVSRRYVSDWAFTYDFRHVGSS